jgi:hypothetical protein
MIGNKTILDYSNVVINAHLFCLIAGSKLLSWRPTQERQDG